MPVEVVGPRPGDAAGLKLLRSVFMKGLAAAALESLEAARAAGAEERVRADIASVIGEPLLERLLTGSQAHAARRVDEMRAAVGLPRGARRRAVGGPSRSRPPDGAPGRSPRAQAGASRWPMPSEMSLAPSS